MKIVDFLSRLLSRLLDKIGITDPWTHYAILGIFASILIYSVPAFILAAIIFN